MKTYHVKINFYNTTAYSIVKVEANNEEEALMSAFDKTEEEYKDRIKKSKVIYVSEYFGQKG